MPKYMIGWDTGTDGYDVIVADSQEEAEKIAKDRLEEEIASSASSWAEPYDGD